MAGFNPQKSSVTHFEPGEAIRRPNFKKRQPTGNGGAEPLPAQIGVSRGVNVHKVQGADQGYAEGDAGDLANYLDEQVGGIDSHLIEMALNSDDPEVFNEVMDIL